MGDIFLVALDGAGPSSLWADALHGQMGLGRVRKAAEQARESEPVSSLLPWLRLPSSDLVSPDNGEALPASRDPHQVSLDPSLDEIGGGVS